MAEGTREKVLEVDRLRSTGLKSEEACRKAGISSPTYYKWKNGSTGDLYSAKEKPDRPSKEAIQKRKYRKRLKLKVTELEDKHVATQKIYMLYGDPNGIAETIRRLEG